MYHYRAVILKVADGDTVTADVDLGFDLKQKQILRLYGIDAFELRDKDLEKRAKGVEGRKFVVNRIPPGTQVEMMTKKDKTEKYGRYLADIYYTDAEGNRQWLNRQLVEAGLAVEYYGEG